VDVASTRAESYEYPGALPKVEHAGIRSDLARRDFTINAMAVSLKPETFGDLSDSFGGREDLEARRIVVLHNLSFIEDPTRILRAIRYESRYGLRMDQHTLNLARACCAMDLVGDLSSARLRDELVSLLDEEKVDFSLRRAEELGVWPAIHGRLRVDVHTRELVRRADSLRAAHDLEYEPPRWRMRLVWLLRDLDPEEITAWTVRMRIRGLDARVLERALVVARRLQDRIARGPSEAELYDLAAGEPIEAILAAMTLDDAGIAADRLARFLDVTRHVRLAIGGQDLLDMGFTSGPRMGDVLRSVLHLKLNGIIATREEELAAAARMLRTA
jgi:tRNA nucleotidyltransferase (CCA-adding enzyme)